MARHNAGYVLLHRKILTSWIAKDGYALAILITLILWANRTRSAKPLRGQLVMLERGQVATSVEELARELQFDAKTVERKLKMLASGETVVEQVSNRGRIITVVNYNKYQIIHSDVVGQKSDRSRTGGGTAGGTAGGHIGDLREHRELDISPLLSPHDLQAIRLTASGLVTRVIGAVRNNLSESDAQAVIGEPGWGFIERSYVNWPGFCRAYAHKYADKPAAADAQLRDFFAAELALQLASAEKYPTN